LKGSDLILLNNFKTRKVYNDTINTNIF